MIDFPDSPSANDTFTSGEKTWRYTGSAWVVVGAQARAVSWSDILSKPDLATAAQGAKADLAVQKVPADASPVSTIRCLTQGEYDALGTYDAQTLYFIK